MPQPTASAKDAVWVLPGPEPDRRRAPQLGCHPRRLRAKLGPPWGGTLRVDLTEVAAGDQHVVAVQHATAEHRSKRLDITACQLMRMEDVRIADVRGQYSDQYAFDDFWAH